MRISDCSSYVCSSELATVSLHFVTPLRSSGASPSLWNCSQKLRLREYFPEPGTTPPRDRQRAVCPPVCPWPAAGRQPGCNRGRRCRPDIPVAGGAALLYIGIMTKPVEPRFQAAAAQLQAAGLRPTRQPLVLAEILFGQPPAAPG